MVRQLTHLVFAAGLLLAPGSAFAGKADVINATATSSGNNTWRISATIEHADEGWKHYADRFEVVAPDGTVLGVRVLYHPHVNEQPFTRSLGGVKVPKGTQKVLVRARDSKHGFGGRVFELKLPK